MSRFLIGSDDELVKQKDGSYQWIREDIGTSPVGQAKLVWAEFADQVNRNELTTLKEAATWAVVLAGALKDVIDESDRRTIDEYQKAESSFWSLFPRRK